MTPHEVWVKDQPTCDGWYPILTCYDPGEGLIPGACEWAGKWVNGNPTLWMLTPFGDEGAAIAAAYENDPDW